jgi:hypothetical protein
MSNQATGTQPQSSIDDAVKEVKLCVEEFLLDSKGRASNGEEEGGIKVSFCSRRCWIPE